ncbi:MAG: C39 family peptidase [Candidatus Omnitrophota bacterium]
MSEKSCRKTIRIDVLVLVALALVSMCLSDARAASFSVGGVRLYKNVKPLREIKRSNLTPQSLDFSCGPAGLATLFHYYLSDPVSEAEIITALLQTTSLEKVRARGGFSLLDLKSFAERRGYVATGFQMDISALRQLGKPVLVPIKFKNYRHFVVVKDVVNDRVFIADPASGNMSLKTHQFERIWLHGIVLLIEPSGGGIQKNNDLELKESDLIFADYSRWSAIVRPSLIRTAIYPTEY